MSELTRLRDEAERILTNYTEHKDSEDTTMRRRAHLQADRFLMEHREAVMLLTVQGLNAEVNRLIEEKRPAPKKPLLKRIWSAIKTETSTS